MSKVAIVTDSNSGITQADGSICASAAFLY